ncbi:MAG: hypothetical protein IKA76_02490 [Clostridia bacterium]|nr:hypothetical protein [Clostridia bacterium]
MVFFRNHMFLMQSDGPPYDPVIYFVGDNPILFPLCVVALFCSLHLDLYYLYFAAKKAKKSHSEKAVHDETVA